MALEVNKRRSHFEVYKTQNFSTFFVYSNTFNSKFCIKVQMNLIKPKPLGILARKFKNKKLSVQGESLVTF